MRQLSPWAPRVKPRIRISQGNILTTTEEHQVLANYCQITFAPTLDAVVRPAPLALSYTAEDWSQHLHRTKIGKAVPSGSAPSTAWKICASAVSDYLSRASACLHGTMKDLWAPWTNPELIWLAKPNKPPDRPANLRPIGLIRPDGKALAGPLKESLIPHLQCYLRSTPQFAYLPGRDLFDAVARLGHALISSRLCNR